MGNIIIKDFSSVEEIIKRYSDGGIKPLDQCINTKKEYLNEDVNSNEYREVALKFREYNDKYENDKRLDGVEDCDNKLFYLFLKEKGMENGYEFRLRNGKSVVAKVDVFNPFVSVSFDEEKGEMVNPQWHLLIAYYAYMDAAFNHSQNEQLLKLTGWNKEKQIRSKFGNNKVLNTWMEEAIEKKNE